MKELSVKILNRMKFNLSGITDRLSYRQKLMSVILGFTLVPFLIFGSVFTYKTLADYKQKILNDNETMLNSKAAELDKLFYSNMQKINYIKNNKLVGAILTTGKDENLVTVLSYYQNAADLFEALKADGLGSNITVYTNNMYAYNGEYVKKAESLEDKFLKELELLEEHSMVLKLDEVNESEGGKYYIKMYGKIESTYGVFGIIEISIPFNKIEELLLTNLPEKNIIVYSDAGSGKSVVLNKDKLNNEYVEKALNQYNSKGSASSFYITDTMLGSSLGKIILLTPKTSISGKFTTYILFMLGGIVLIVLIIILTARLISISLTRQLTELVDSVNTDTANLVGSGEIMISTKNNEFGIINHKFVELVTKIKEVYSQITDYEVRKRMLEVELLQANINPHFLYNTLSAIKWTYPDKNLIKIIDSLVKYYRIALNRGNNVLKVSQEIEMIIEYINIQKFAYSFTFQHDINLDPSVMESYTLKNILQPIVENAILHGIRARENGGILSISGTLQNGSVIIAIEDNGPGIPGEKLEHLLEEECSEISGGYGLRNVNTRIKTYYGAEYGLAVSSAEGFGTKVTITTPFLDTIDSK